MKRNVAQVSVLLSRCQADAGGAGRRVVTNILFLNNIVLKMQIALKRANFENRIQFQDHYRKSEFDKFHNFVFH